MFELNRKDIQYEFRYPGVATPLVATLSWPSPEQFRALFRDMKAEAKSVGDDTLELRASDNPHFLPFLQEHLIGVESGNARKLAFTIDDFKERLGRSKRLDASRALVLEGLIGASIVDAPALDPDAELTLDELERGDVTIEIDCWEGGQVVVHTLKHVLMPADTSQQKAYQAAHTLRQRRDRTFRVQDVHAVTKLYEARIRAIGGASWDGEPCADENRDAWVKAVPYSWIRAVMAEDARVADKVGPT